MATAAAQAPQSAQDQNDEFDIARKRAKREANAALQGQQDALKRRFATLGNLNSGARLKLEQKAQDSVQRRLGEANETIGAAERAEDRRRQEIAEGRKFQSSEREASQGFAAQQAELGRNFTSQEAALQRKYLTGERLSSQEFAALQNATQREFATREREASEGFASKQNEIGRAQQKELFQKEMEQRLAAFNEQVRQFNETFSEEVRVTDANLETARKQLEDKGFFDSDAGQGALAGAATGAAIGSVVPVVGTAIGGLAGAAIGGIGGSQGWFG